MSNNSRHTAPFRFKRFTIRQSRAAMKVGFDGILLGAWSDVRSCGRMLDVGTGTGLLALMLAQRTQRDSDLTAGPAIDAVEIDGSACEEAEGNVAISPWAGRITVHRTSIQDYALSTPSRYKLVACNPPYFECGRPSPDASRALARQTSGLTFEDLSRAAAHVLDADGQLSVILPAASYETSCRTARDHQLFCRRTTWVQPTPSKVAHRVLVEFRRQAGACTEHQLAVEERRHAYTNEFRELAREFYLAF